jgi:GNAT superfamily N-acetyltransferase
MARPYRPTDSDDFWELKRGYELSLGTGTGGDAKESAYRDKLDADYRAGYLEWVRRCVDENPRTVQVAERDGDLVGYVFLLPESLTHIWDAAVLNEIFVVESRRGTGVADDLMEAALTVARTQDPPIDRLLLDVDPDNDRAGAFYDRWGFEHWGDLVVREL